MVRLATAATLLKPETLLLFAMVGGGGGNIPLVPPRPPPPLSYPPQSSSALSILGFIRPRPLISLVIPFCPFFADSPILALATAE